MKRLAGIAAAGVGLLSATHALADPRLDEKVYDPYIKNRVWEVEARWGQEVDGPLAGERSTVLEAEYGLNDRVSLALVGEIGRDVGGGDQFHAIGVEGVVYLGRAPVVGVDTGLYLEVAHGLNGESDGLEAKLLFAKRIDRFEGLFNLIVERPFNVPAGQGFTSYGYAASATWEVTRGLKLGAEAFGDFGDDHGFLDRPQGAYVGPHLKWEFRPGSSPLEIGINAGWLKSVGADTAEANSQVRIGLELERRF